MDNMLQQQLEDAIWVAKTLFDRNKATGSSANISFRVDDKVYISGTGTSLGRLAKDDFAVMDMDGTLLAGAKPSKEFPLHLHCYRHDPEAGAVIHTHSFHCAVWSIIKDYDSNDAVPKYTPYLDMKLGKIRTVPYAPPGSETLFDLFASRLGDGKGYLLENHGPVVFDKNLLAAFYGLEELEESCRIALAMRGTDAERIK